MLGPVQYGKPAADQLLEFDADAFRPLYSAAPHFWAEASIYGCLLWQHSPDALSLSSGE